MKTKTMIVLVILAATAIWISGAQSAIAASAQEDVLQVAENWTRAFNTSDFNLMSSLLWNSPKATRFGPSKGGAFLMQGGASINEFWKSTLASTKGAIAISSHNVQATLIGDDMAVITQYVTSTYTDPTSKEQSIGQARGTFVVQKIKGKWLIVHEHGSYLPVE